MGQGQVASSLTDSWTSNSTQSQSATSPHKNLTIRHPCVVKTKQEESDPLISKLSLAAAIEAVTFQNVLQFGIKPKHARTAEWIMDGGSYESDGGESVDLFETDGGEEESEFSEIFSLENNFELQATHEQGQSVQLSTVKSSEASKVPAELSVSDAANPLTNKSMSPLKPNDAHPSPTFSPSPPMSRIGLNAHKAGMEGLDKTKINQIILEASKGSKFYENEVKKEKQVTERINHMLKEMKKITPAQKLSALKAADKEVELLEVSRDLRHIIVHIDMDAFYAAVEMRDNPKLKDVPMAVGSNYMLVRILQAVC